MEKDGEREGQRTWILSQRGEKLSRWDFAHETFLLGPPLLTPMPKKKSYLYPQTIETADVLFSIL